MVVIASLPSVLILVLVEHTLGVLIRRQVKLSSVLILVLVEHTLGESIMADTTQNVGS